MKIISISGLDGSGKSTQIQLLKDYLEARGKRVFYFHAVKFSLLNISADKLRKLSYNIKWRSRDYVISDNFEKSVTKSSWLGILLRKMALKADIFRFKKLVRKLEKEGFDYILTDRYFYDTIVNIEYLSLPKRSFGIPKLRFGKPDMAIYLQTDPEIIMQRERKPDQGIEYLKKKKEIYDKYAKDWNLKIVEGNRLKEEIFESLKNLL